MRPNIAVRAALPDPEWQQRKKDRTGFHDIHDEPEDHPAYPLAGTLKRRAEREIKQQRERWAREEAAARRAASIPFWDRVENRAKQMEKEQWRELEKSNPVKWLKDWTGATVKYRDVLELGDANAEMIVVEDRGDRVEVIDESQSHWRIQPRFVRTKKELFIVKKPEKNPMRRSNPYIDVSNRMSYTGSYTGSRSGRTYPPLSRTRTLSRTKPKRKRAGLSAVAKKKISNFIKRKAKGRKLTPKQRGKLLAQAMKKFRKNKPRQKDWASLAAQGGKGRISKKNPSTRTRLVSVQVRPTSIMRSGNQVRAWAVSWRTHNMPAAAHWYYATKGAAQAAAARLRRGSSAGGGLRTRTRTKTKSKRNQYASKSKSYSKRLHRSKTKSKTKRYSRSRSRYSKRTPAPMQKIYSKALEVRASGSVNSGTYGIKKSMRFAHKFTSSPGIYGITKSGCYRLKAGTLVIKGRKSLFRKFGPKAIASASH